jgi:hypothetical protein
MAQKPCQTPPFEPRAEIRTDLALIATAVGASLVALIYLILI